MTNKLYKRIQTIIAIALLPLLVYAVILELEQRNNDNDNNNVVIQKPMSEVDKIVFGNIEAINTLERERVEAEKLIAAILEAERLENEQAHRDMQINLAESMKADAAFIAEMEAIEAERLKAEAIERERVLTVIAKVIYKEARGEPFEGQVAVGASIINRTKCEHGFFDKTVDEVIVGQYASITNVTDEMLAEYPNCRKAAELAMAGEDPLAERLGGPTLYFYNPDDCSDEALYKREGLFTIRIGNHLFYTHGVSSTNYTW